MVMRTCDELNDKGEFVITTCSSGYIALNEEQALQLVCKIIKVFQVPESNIEVIHFPQGASKVECLRNSADRLEELGEDSSEESCPLAWIWEK